jgi:hypothetical protein
LVVPHSSLVAAAAAHLITRGRYRNLYWFSLLGGAGVPLLLVVLVPANTAVLAVAGTLALIGLFAYEWAFVMAPQAIPNS